MSKRQTQVANPAFATPETRLLPYASLNPSSYNPRQISPRQIDALKAGIRKHGLVEALVVNEDGTIIGGHQRYRAAREIAIEDGTEVPDLPCVVLSLSKRDEKRLNIALNNVSGDWDQRLLGELLSDIHEQAPIEEQDVLVLGYDTLAEVGGIIGGELGESMGGLDADDGTGPRGTTKAPSLSIDFPSKELRDATKAAIAAATGKDEPSGAALARLIGVGEVRAERKTRTKKAS